MSRRYNELHLDQARAKWSVQNHVKRGHIVKPERCQACGQPFSKKELQAHHADYARPLDVTWLCDACHKAIHKELSGKA